jgi:ubiquinone/menaquinone biosynthesis C-methylase UbiE
MRTSQASNKQRKAMIQNGFDTVAEGYDHPSLCFFPETASRLVVQLQLKPTDKLLDVCTGTGCVALTAAEKLSWGKVTGIDFSSGMLQQAKKNKDCCHCPRRGRGLTLKGECGEHDKC